MKISLGRSVFFALSCVSVVRVLDQGVATGQFEQFIEDKKPVVGTVRKENQSTAHKYAEIVHIKKGRGGQYFTTIKVNGAPIEVLIDTGASNLVLREEDAYRAGLRPQRKDYTQSASTANGLVAIAVMPVKDIEIGYNIIRNQHVSVIPDKSLSISLLGMDVLSEFGRIEISNGEIVLDPRG
ncbi:MAG: TIGR02281 family clan AA aspartic protease [Parvularculaceae bacterium]